MSVAAKEGVCKTGCSTTATQPNRLESALLYGLETLAVFSRYRIPVPTYNCTSLCQGALAGRDTP